MKLVNLKNILFGTFCTTAASILSTNAFSGVPCNITCPTGYQKVQTATSCYCDKLSTPDNSAVTLQQYNDTAVVTINGVAHDWNNAVPTTLSTDTDEPGDNNSTDCAVKQVGEDFVRCCKDEVVTPPTEGPTSTPQVTTGNGNENGCGNQCHTSCSNYGGTVYTGLGSWTGGTLVSAANCRDGCYCVKGATAGGTSANSGIITDSGGTSGSSTTELSGGGSGGLSGSSGTPYQGYQGNLAR